MTGPLCHQGIMDPIQIDEFKAKRVVDLVMEVGGPIMALAVGVIISLLNSILELDPSVLGPITGTKKVVRKLTLLVTLAYHCLSSTSIKHHLIR